MENHIKNKEIVQYILEKEKSGLDDVTVIHILNCPQCNKKYMRLSQTLKSVPGNELSPSDSVESRLLETYQEYKEKRKKKPLNFYQGKMPVRTKALIAASILIALSTVLIIFNYRTFIGTRSLIFAYSNVKNNVFINEQVINEDARIKNGTNIRTGNNSSISIDFFDICNIIIAGNTSLMLEKSTYQKEGEKYTVTFKLGRGTIHSLSNSKGKDLVYTFILHNYEITTLGTEFVIYASDTLSSVFLIDGKLIVKNIYDGTERILNKNKKYILGKNIEDFRIDPDEQKIISIIKKHPSYINNLVFHKERHTFTSQTSRINKVERIRVLQK